VVCAQEQEIFLFKRTNAIDAKQGIFAVQLQMAI
jgi:hypothetical protein